MWFPSVFLGDLAPTCEVLPAARPDLDFFEVFANAAIQLVVRHPAMRRS
jgi:hypothetical protein